MKKTIVMALSLVAGVTIASPSFAGDSDSVGYFGISGLGFTSSDVDFDNGRTGGTSHTAEFDTGMGVLLRGGRDFGNVRAELELGYRNADLDSVDVVAATNVSGEANLYTIMANAAWDFETDSEFSPYVSLGLGAIIAEGDLGYTDSSGNEHKKNFYGAAPAGQIGLGVGYEINDQVDMVVGYSLLASPTDDTNKSQTVLLHSVQIGLNYGF